MDKLIVKNFGPIKDIEIDVNDINVYIGPTSSGKSVAAKLISIFKSVTFLKKSSYGKFIDLLIEYNVDFKVELNTEIIYLINDTFWKIGFNSFSSSNKYEEEIQEIFAIDSYQKGSMDVEDKVSIKYLLNYMAKLPDEFLVNETEEGRPNRELDSKKFKQHFYNSYKDAIDEIGISSTIYVPAERILLSMIGESLFGLMKNDVSIAQCVKEFGAMFETSRKHMKTFDLTFLRVKYEYTDKNNYLILSDGTRIKLEVASSGFQSIVPLMLVMEYFAEMHRQIDNCFIIEEPELNLYPSMQKSLIEFIISKVNNTGDRLIITTHSPYTLTALDNLIQAKSAYDKHPELKEEIAKTVPENLWLDFSKVACYYFEDGYCRSTMDEEMQSIGPSNIDDISEDLGRTFDKLLELKYQD